MGNQRKSSTGTVSVEVEERRFKAEPERLVKEVGSKGYYPS
jgi:hypothetical protein